jgi:hypothetical protein
LPARLPGLASGSCPTRSPVQPVEDDPVGRSAPGEAFTTGSGLNRPATVTSENANLARPTTIGELAPAHFRGVDRSSLLAHVQESRDWLEERPELSIVELRARLSGWPSKGLGRHAPVFAKARARERKDRQGCRALTTRRRRGAQRVGARPAVHWSWSTRFGPNRHGPTLWLCCRCHVASSHRGDRRRRRRAELSPTRRSSGNQGPDEATVRASLRSQAAFPTSPALPGG